MRVEGALVEVMLVECSVELVMVNLEVVWR
jgi:hypothetical protein